MKPKYMKEYIEKGMSVYKKYDCSFDIIKNPIKSKEKTLIIVPYRDNKFQKRKEQLDDFKKHFKDYDVLIVEQSEDNRKFNRGALLNIGFIYAYKNYKYVIFHDVDILTPHDVIESEYFNELKGVLHLGSLTDKFNGASDSFFGAINKFDIESFKKINGFANTFWGWGDEDVILYYRCCHHKINMYRPLLKNVVSDSDKEPTNKIKELTNETRYEKRIFDYIYKEIDGLINTGYYVKDTIQEGKLTHIIVDIY